MLVRICFYNARQRFSAMKNRVLAASPCPTGQERTDKPEPCVTDETLFCIDGVGGWRLNSF